MDELQARMAELGPDWYLHCIGPGYWNLVFMPFRTGATSCSRRAETTIGAESISGCLDIALQKDAEEPIDA